MKNTIHVYKGFVYFPVKYIYLDLKALLPTMGGRNKMNKIISLTLFLLFVFSTSVYAHTGLTSSSPADGDNITDEINEIVLEFNTKIESTSTVKVFNEKNEGVAINTLVNDSIITGGFMTPLDNGTYSVEWKIIGEDGHPIQGTYSFIVNKDELEDSVAAEESKITPVLPTEEIEEKQVEQQVEAPSKIASNDVLVVILVILFTIAGGFFGWIIGRRQNK